MKDNEKTREQLLHELTELRLQNAALKKSESAEKYRSLVENIREVIYELDSQGMVLYISPAIRDILGFDSGEIVGKNFIELAYKDDLSSRAEWFSELRKSREDPSEYRVLNKSGEIRWVRTKTRPIMEDGLFKGACGILIDFTAQRQVEEALRESEEKYRLIAENTANLISILDMNLRFTYVSPATMRHRGFSVEEAMEQTLEQVLTPESMRLGRTVFEEEMQLEASGTADPDRMRILELEEYKKDGSMIWMEVSFSVLRDKDRKPVEILMVSRDITDRKHSEEALRERDIQFMKLSSWVPGMIYQFTKRPDGTYCVPFTTEAIKDIFGCSPQDVREDFSPIARIILPEDFDKVFGSIEYSAKHLTIWTCEYRVQIPGQSIRWVSGKATPEKSADGSITWYGFNTDITERKRADEKLRESEKKYRELYDFLPIPVYEMDFEANIISANRAIYETFRGTEEDLKNGFKGWQLLSPEEIEKSSKNIQRLLKGEQIKGTEYTLMRLDGTVFPAIVISSVIYSDGKPVGLRGAIIDITERKRAEEALKESESKYRVIAENMTDVIAVVDMNMRFTFLSPSIKRLRGFTVEEAMEQPLEQVMTPESLLLVSRGYEEEMQLESSGTADPDRVHIIEMEEYRKDMSTVWVEANLSFLRDADGRPIGMLSLTRDISKRKKAEEALRETLESLRKAFGTIIQVMVSAVETRDPYTAGHQIRSADLARAIATEMGLPPEKIEGIRMAGSIHDIGKLSIPAEILSKPTKLSEIEFALIKEHARRGFEMLKDVESPWPLAEIVHQHHERMDGSGYPRNLKGDDILIEARILAVADVVEAMASHRPYRPGLGIDAALEEIEKNRGTIYDKTVADACLRLFREKGFKLEGS